MCTMAKLIMFGHYSSEALTKISSQRTEMAKKIISDHGGEMGNMYALLGETDLVLMVDFPDVEKAMQASIAMSRQTGIQFRTYPAVEVTDFDRMMEGNE